MTCICLTLDILSLLSGVYENLLDFLKLMIFFNGSALFFVFFWIKLTCDSTVCFDGNKNIRLLQLCVQL